LTIDARGAVSLAVSNSLQILTIQKIGDTLALRWSDGREDYIPLPQLRSACPCASCAGENDLTGNVMLPRADPSGFCADLAGWQFVGSYGFQPRWEDGHATGIYSLDYLRCLGEAAE